MTERWAGVIVSGSKIVCVEAEVPTSGDIEILSDMTMALQAGARAEAYSVTHQQFSDYLQNHKIEKVFVKASVAGSTVGKAHLEAAELRGVVLAASAAHSDVVQMQKNTISRTFGNRKVDEYIKDDKFWASNISGKLRSGSREAALMLLAAREAA